MALEAALFGSASAAAGKRRATQAGSDGEGSDASMQDVEDNDLFFVDDAATDRAPKAAKKTERKKGKAAWVDEDDETLVVNVKDNKRLRKLRDAEDEEELPGTTYENRLRRQYEQLNPTPAWLSKARRRKRRQGGSDDDDDEEPVGDLLTSTGSILAHSRPATLPPNDLQITRLRDATLSAPARGTIHTALFHPSPAVPVLLTTSADRRVRLYTVDGHTNPHLQTLHVPELPAPRALFHPAGGQAFLTGARPHFWTLDLQSGTCLKSHRLDVGSTAVSAVSPAGTIFAVAGAAGAVHLLDARARQPVAQIKANSPVAALQFGVKDDELVALGMDAEVYVFDVRARRCTGRWKDTDGFGSSTLATSSSSGYMATGSVIALPLAGMLTDKESFSSSTGYVNIYKAADDSFAGKPALQKALPHLTTRVSCLQFNADAQILAMTSSAKKDQLKLVHLPSFTVFRNWPTSGTPLHTVSAVAFSPGSEYLVVGNAAGRVLLYHLPYFAPR
ncbi:WD40 repeat-like protein [Auricularia subglabra TFB-10046 SS5]|nr:WD40 repeat-like protein [Auricularia subglabra TFB-10046 SS5]